MTWKTLESCIALAANLAKDYLKYKTSDTKEKKALENDIEQNPENYIDSENTAIAKEAADLLDDDKRNDEVNNDSLRQEDAYAMGQEENNYPAPEQFKQVGAFLGGKPSTIEDVDYTVEDVPNEEQPQEQQPQLLQWQFSFSYKFTFYY